MPRYWTLGHRLPSLLSGYLFGHRHKFEFSHKENDPDWQEWQDFYMNFYQGTQKQGIGKKVNDAGYRILRRVDLTGKRVLELGPGILPHRKFWNGKPLDYTVIDIKQEFLNDAVQVLQASHIPARSHLSTSVELPLENAEFDVILGFYCFEHFWPLSSYIAELKRTLRPGGIVVGAIPTEGGLAWGTGRLLTSRPFIKRHSTLDFNKIICWEHPNFAETILRELQSAFEPRLVRFWPLDLPLVDLNLIISFIYRKESPGEAIDHKDS